MIVDLETAREARKTPTEIIDDYVQLKVEEAGENWVFKAKIGEDRETVKAKAEAQGAVFIEWLKPKSVGNNNHCVDLLFYIFDDAPEEVQQIVRQP